MIRIMLCFMVVAIVGCAAPKQESKPFYSCDNLSAEQELACEKEHGKVFDAIREHKPVVE